jgi:hypothetical protein
MDDTLLKRDISNTPTGMYSSETLQNKKSQQKLATAAIVLVLLQQNKLVYWLQNICLS